MLVAPAGTVQEHSAEVLVNVIIWNGFPSCTITFFVKWVFSTHTVCPIVGSDAVERIKNDNNPSKVVCFITGVQYYNDPKVGLTNKFFSKNIFALLYLKQVDSYGKGRKRFHYQLVGPNQSRKRVDRASL